MSNKKRISYISVKIIVKSLKITYVFNAHYTYKPCLTLSKIQ